MWLPEVRLDTRGKVSARSQQFRQDVHELERAMQAIGSSTNYLARYVLMYSLGIVPKNTDDDGGAATGGLSEQAIEEYCTKIKDSWTNIEDLQAAFKEGWEAAGSLPWYLSQGNSVAGT